MEHPIFADATHPATYKAKLEGVVSTNGKAEYISGEVAITESLNNIVGTDTIYTVVMAITGAQPVLGTSITMNYNVNIRTDLVGSTTPTMTFTFHGKEYDVIGEAGEPIDYYIAGKLSGQYTPYTFSFMEISPQCMGDAIDVVLKVDDKKVYKNNYSLESYCRSMLNKSDAEFMTSCKYSADKAAQLRILLSDILVYGSAAQEYKGYKTSEKVGEGISEEKFTPTGFETLEATDRVITACRQ